MNKSGSKSDKDQRYVPASSANLFLDRSGNENEYEPKYLRKIIDYYRHMGMIQESSLPLSRDLYGGLEQAIVSSGFHEEDNEFADLLGEFEQTEAAQVMQDSLNQYFDRLAFPISVVVISLDEISFGKSKPRLQNNSSPNRFVVGAQADLDENGDGLIYLLSVTAEEDFDSSAVDPIKVAKKASTVMRHELMHDRQYISLAVDKGISKKEAKKKFEDWGLIPLDGAPREKYLGSHIEIDAYGHEFAEELAQELGLEKAMKLVATSDARQMQKLARAVSDNLSDNFREYYDHFSGAEFTKKLQKKIRKYLRAFSDEKVYHSRIEERVVLRLAELAAGDIITDTKGNIR